MMVAPLIPYMFCWSQGLWLSQIFSDLQYGERNHSLRTVSPSFYSGLSLWHEAAPAIRTWWCGQELTTIPSALVPDHLLESRCEQERQMFHNKAQWGCWTLQSYSKTGYFAAWQHYYQVARMHQNHGTKFILAQTIYVNASSWDFS